MKTDLRTSLPATSPAPSGRVPDSGARRASLPARLALVVVSMLLTSAAIPAAALASSASVDSYHDNLTYTAAAGEQNDVRVSASGSTYTIEDPSATINPGIGCSPVTPNKVTCNPIWGGPITYVYVRANDKDDAVTVAGGFSALVDAGSGSDRIVGGSGKDWLLGSSGDDTLDGGLGSDVLSGGDGSDMADYSTRTAALTIALDGAAGDGEAGENDSLSTTIEGVTGGAGNDTIAGGGAADKLNGGAGDDAISGGAGDDTVDGGSGHDVLDGGDGGDAMRSVDGLVDRVTCGAGIDTADADAIDLLAADCDLPAIPNVSTGPAGPTGALDLLPASVRITRRGTVPLPIACPARSAGSCKGTVKLFSKSSGHHKVTGSRRSRYTLVGRSKFSLGAGKTKVIKVKLSRNGRQRVLRQRKLRCRASAVTRVANGGSSTVGKTITLRAPKRRKG
jgi:hypothetical protein